MAIDPRLIQLLKSWRDLSDVGQTPTPEDHCRECPELFDAFRRLLRRFEQLDANCSGVGVGQNGVHRTAIGATSCEVLFRVDGEPRRGGLGELFPARDEELGRTVALKFIQRGKGGAKAERRFRREIAVTARMHHPGIVPVYGSVVSDDGRTGYATLFIPGESLDEAIIRHHKRGTAGTEKPTQANLLDRFEAICNAMAYAHSHGVIHRDLKPANVMLGKHGETFVVDWGLAKVLGDDLTDEGGELTAITTPGDDSTAEAISEPGEFIGTYNYMPPEQACGDYANQNERADVFALGGILCKILTGQPPYTGTHAKQMAREADLTDCFARLDASNADTELKEVVRCCLKKSATDRPRDAHGVLELVRWYKAAMEARAREDREGRVAAEAKAVAERRRRRATVALAISIVVMLIVGGGGFWKWDEQRLLRQNEKSYQDRQTRENAEAALARLDELFKHSLWTEADALLVRTENLIGSEGDADLRERVAEAKRNTAFVKRLDEIRLAKSAVVDGQLNSAGALREYRAAFEENGFHLFIGNRAVLATKLNTSAVRKYLLEALDDWAVTEEEEARRKVIMAVTALATRQTWRTQLSDVWKDGDRLAELYDGIPNNERTPAIIVAVGWRLDSMGKDGLRRMDAGVRQYPRDFWLHIFTGAIGGKERIDTRLGALRTALAIRPHTPVIFNNLGYVLSEKQDYAGAVAEFKEAIRLDPKYASPHNGLGNVYCDNHEYDAASAEFEEAIRLDPKFARPHNGLGNVLSRKKEYEAAIAQYKEAIRLDPKCATPHYNLGNVQFDKRKFDTAIAAYLEAIRLDPKFAWPHNGLGYVHLARKEYGAAIAEFKEANRLDPTGALPHNGLGNVQYDKKEYKAAMAEFNEAIRLEPKLAAPHIGLGNVYHDKKEYDAATDAYKEAIRRDPRLATAHYNLGNVYYEKKEYYSATAAYKVAIGLDPKYAGPHNGLGNVLYDKKEYAGAVAEFKEAIRLDPKFARPHNGLGNVYCDKKEYDAAIAAYKEAIRLDPKYAWPHNGLGNVLYDKKECDSANVEFKEAIRLDPKLAAPHNGLGNVHYDKSEYDAAIAEFKEAVTLDPKFATPRNGMGNAQLAKKDYDAAIIAYMEATRLDPKLAAPHNGLGNVLFAKKEYDAAIAEFKEAICLDPTGTLPHNGLGNVLSDKKEYDAAAAAYKEAIRLDPGFATPHYNLGNLHFDKNEYDAAAAEFKAAIRLAPKLGVAHYNLGNVLQIKKDYDAAIIAYTEAMRLDPKLAAPHNGLGNVLFAKKEYDAAIAEFKEAIDLDADYVLAHVNLGLVYKQLGRFDDAVRALRIANQLMPKHVGIQFLVRDTIECQALDQRLPAIRSGMEKPRTPMEAIRFADFCLLECKKEHALAFRLFTDAFAVDPKRAEASRYNAACAAVQFAAGNDVRAKFGIEEWYHLQKQAHIWLIADLAFLRKIAVSDIPAERHQAKVTLSHWLEDSDLSPVRDAVWLKVMPDDERKVWQSHWADVQEILKKLDSPRK